MYFVIKINKAVKTLIKEFSLPIIFQYIYLYSPNALDVELLISSNKSG